MCAIHKLQNKNKEQLNNRHFLLYVNVLMIKSEKLLGLDQRNELQNANFTLTRGSFWPLKRCEHLQELWCLNKRERKEKKPHRILTSDIIFFFIQIHHSSIFQLQALRLKSRLTNVPSDGRFARLGNRTRVRYGAECKTISATCDMRPHPCTHREMEQRGSWGKH